MGSYFLKITAETVKFLSNLSVRSLNWEGRFAMSSHFFILLKNSIKLKIPNGLDLKVGGGFLFVCFPEIFIFNKSATSTSELLIRWRYYKHDNIVRASPSPINKD